MQEFDAAVEEVINDVEIILNHTAFYPNSGGQPNDIGVLECHDVSYNIIDVIKKEGKIIHKVDKAGLAKGDKVYCKIDWERRYKLMRYHTASHILATAIHNETGAEITGNQLYLDKARVDFSLDNFDRALMKGFEEKANEIISKNLPVGTRILDREEAFKIPSLVKLRKVLPETIKDIRVVDIFDDSFDFDHQACGGTHLKNTSEIGKIEIFELENKGKDRRRIYFRIL
jgi:misacylated tRNA(Ala) deacylase